jgi:exonuclease VII large subunit
MSQAYQDADREYGRNREELMSQRGYAEQQKGRSLSNLESALEAVKGTVGRSREEAQAGYDSDIRSASDSAKDVERKNRNTLRALGILGSSAAGELLSKPWNQFDQQKAQLREGVRRRFTQLDDFMVQKTQEHANMVAELEGNFSNLVEQIDRDLSFNAEERLAAKKQANSAYKQRLTEIKGAQLQWEQAVATNKQNLINEATSMGQNTDLLSKLDTSGISGSLFTPKQTGSPESVGIYGEEEDDETALLPYQLQDQRTNPLLSIG